MNKKLLSFLLIGTLVIGLTGCGSTNSNKEEINKKEEKIEKKETLEGLDFNYSNNDSASSNIGKEVDYTPVVNNKFESYEYEGIKFSNNDDYPGKLSKESITDNALSNLKWIVFADDGTNVMITTSEPVRSSVVINGTDGYNNSVQALNAICAKFFSNDKYTARSMTIEDIEMYFKDKSDEWKRNRTPKQFVSFYNDTYGMSGFKIEDSGSNKKAYPAIFALEKDSGKGTLKNSETPDGYKPYNKGNIYDSSSTEKFISTYYYVNGKELKDNLDANIANIFLREDSYWLANRSVSVNDEIVWFWTRFVDSSYRSDLTGYYFISIFGSAAGDSHYIRPVVVIPKSDLGLN